MERSGSYATQQGAKGGETFDQQKSLKYDQLRRETATGLTRVALSETFACGSAGVGKGAKHAFIRGWPGQRAQAVDCLNCSVGHWADCVQSWRCWRHRAALPPLGADQLSERRGLLAASAGKQLRQEVSKVCVPACCNIRLPGGGRCWCRCGEARDDHFVLCPRLAEQA